MVYIIMGVSGCGKTTIGELLAKKMKVPFFDADNFHPPSNIQKMSKGIPLEDSDRIPWLYELKKLIAGFRNGTAVLACSALKQKYRDILCGECDFNYVKFIYLKGSKELISSRIEKRHNHFFNPELLSSQFKTLEEPVGALVIGIEDTPQQICNRILKALKFGEHIS